MLPWIVDDQGFRLGISQPDGLLTLIGGGVALALAWRRIPAGWIVTGFLAVLLGRDVAVLLGSEVRTGIGLWMGAAAFTAAAVVQFTELVRSRLAKREPE